jgi:LmbE family N-acetylglucosaminyl deacetylase
MKSGASAPGRPWRALRRSKAAVDKKLMSAVLPRLARSWTHDVTADLTAGRLLVLAPHPDDETLGCGATVIRSLRQGSDVLVVVATDGRSVRPDGDPNVMAVTRRNEVAAATKVLGLTAERVRILDFLDGDLHSHEDTLAACLTALVRSWQPTTVLVSAVCDPHPDHAALGRAARRAVVGENVALFEYMIWGWVNPTRWFLGSRCFTRGGAARVSRAVTVRTEGALSTKRAALCCHRSQFGPSVFTTAPSAGDRPSASSFLTNFFGDVEVFFPVNARSLSLAGFDVQTRNKQRGAVRRGTGGLGGVV